MAAINALHLVAFAIPGACVVMVAVITSTMLGQRATLVAHATAGGRRSTSQSPTKHSKRARRTRSARNRQSPDGAPPRTRLQELLVEQPDISAAVAAPLIERSPSYTRALLAELRGGGV